jgi:hypothetical protein
LSIFAFAFLRVVEDGVRLGQVKRPAASATTNRPAIHTARATGLPRTALGFVIMSSSSRGVMGMVRPVVVSAMTAGGRLAMVGTQAGITPLE